MNRKQKKMLIRILIAAALMVVIRVLYASVLVSDVHGSLSDGWL